MVILNDTNVDWLLRGFLKLKVLTMMTFAPVARFNTISSLLAMAVNRGMIIEQMDVVTAFLNGKLKEEIFMSQPPGFVEKGKEELVYRLMLNI